jgi:Fic family protein
MAHLHVVAIHPFRDGNGRVARIAQSLVLAREGLVSFEFASIEQYLGERTQDYYDVLERTQGGSYKPERSPREWVEFCVDAHVEQAQRRLAQIAAAGERWSALEAIVERRGWPDRMVVALEQSLAGGTDRSRYAREADVSPATASADLRRLLDASLLVQRGHGPSSRYLPADALRAEIG